MGNTKFEINRKNDTEISVIDSKRGLPRPLIFLFHIDTAISNGNFVRRVHVRCIPNYSITFSRAMTSLLLQLYNWKCPSPQTTWFAAAVMSRAVLTWSLDKYLHAWVCLVDCSWHQHRLQLYKVQILFIVLSPVLADCFLSDILRRPCITITGHPHRRNSWSLPGNISSQMMRWELGRQVKMW